MYVPVGSSQYMVYASIRVCALSLFPGLLGREPPVEVSHVLRYRVTDNVTFPVVAETNNEEDRADVYPRSVRKRRLLGFTDTTPDRF